MEQNLYSGNYNPPEEDNVDIKRYISMFISNWYWFAGALFIAISLAYGINKYSERIFTVTSTMLIKDDQTGGVFSSLDNVIPGGDIFKRQQNLQNEMGILKSYMLNYKAMEHLKDFHVVYVGIGKRGIVERRMYKTCPFIVSYDSLRKPLIGPKVNVSILSEDSVRIVINDDKNINKVIGIGAQFNEAGFDFKIERRFSTEKIFDPDASNKFIFWFTTPGNLANQYRSSLSVNPIQKDASVVTLSVTGFVPEQEADYLNMLMEVYISYWLDIKNKTAENAIKFIDEQLVIISDSLTHAEGSLEKFRLDNSFLNLSNEGAIIQRKLEDFENIKTSFELQLHYYEYLSEYLDSKNKNATIISPTVMGISDQVLLNLVEEYSTMQKEKEKLSLNLEINQPAVELLERGMNQIQLAMRENIKNGNTTLTGSIDEENKKIAVIESEIRKLPTTERKLINIQRKFDLNNTVYTYMLEKRAESSIAMASHVSDNRRIDEANFLHASMIKPRTRINYMFAVFFGLFLPMVWILLMDYFNDKVLDAKDIEKMTSIPIIGYVGHNEGHSELYVTEKPGSSFAESFRSIRTSIKYFIKENNKPVISISSTVSSEGKTFTAINLSAIIAMNGKKVLLIGLDMRKPSLSRAFNIDTTNGMSSYLSGNCEYEVVIKETLVKNLFYAPSGPVPPNPAELIERPEMKLFIEKAKAEFDFILIDTPPVAIVTDALLLAELVDLNLFIVRQRYTTRKSLEFMEKLNKNNELKKMAIVVNDISLDGYYGYGLRYGYTMGYGYTYGTGYYGKGYLSRYGYDDKGRGYYHDED